MLAKTVTDQHPPFEEPTGLDGGLQYRFWASLGHVHVGPTQRVTECTWPTRALKRYLWNLSDSFQPPWPGRKRQKKALEKVCTIISSNRCSHESALSR